MQVASNFEYQQSVLGRNKSICDSSHMLCCGCVQLYVIRNTFASYIGGAIQPCRANKADCQ